MLNAGPIAVDATGLKNLPVASFPGPFFNGGTPLSTLQELVTTTAAPARFNGGLGYDDAGALCIDTGSAVAGAAQGGMPVSAAGALCVVFGGSVDFHNAGIPFAGSRVALAPPSAIVNLSAFDSGFDGGFG